MSQYNISPLITSDIDFDVGSWSGYNYFPIDCSGGNININLPSSLWPGLSFYFNRVDSSTNILTFIPNTGTIENNSTLTASGKTIIECVYDGVGNWYAPKSSYI